MRARKEKNTSVVLLEESVSAAMMMTMMTTTAREVRGGFVLSFAGYTSTNRVACGQAVNEANHTRTLLRQGRCVGCKTLQIKVEPHIYLCMHLDHATTPFGDYYHTSLALTSEGAPP